MWRLDSSTRDRLWRDAVALFGRAGLGRVAGMLELLGAPRPGFHDHGAQRTQNLWLPGLPSRPWFAPEELPWTAALAGRGPAVAAELAALERAGGGFGPYLDAPDEQANPHVSASGLAPPERGWQAYFLCRDGAWSRAGLAACPETARAVALAPVADGDVMFSRLAARAEIPPHHGLDNLSLTCHLGLRVPEGCALEVDGERRRWCEGACLVFDDSFRHAAWNRSSAARVVLLFDFWHPGLTRVEVSALRLLVPEIKRHNAAPRSPS